MAINKSAIVVADSLMRLNTVIGFRYSAQDVIEELESYNIEKAELKLMAEFLTKLQKLNEEA